MLLLLGLVPRRAFCPGTRETTIAFSDCYARHIAGSLVVERRLDLVVVERRLLNVERLKFLLSMYGLNLRSTD